MEDTLIEFETAALAKKKKFDWEVIQYYVKSKELCPIENIEGGIIEGNYLYYDFNSFGKDYYSFRDKLEEHISAPTQSLLGKWLREKHNIYFYVDADYSKEKYWFISNIFDCKEKIILSDEYFGHFDTFEQAYEKGLQEALKLIK